MQTPGCYEHKHLEKTEVLFHKDPFCFLLRGGAAVVSPVCAPVLHVSLFISDVLVRSVF